MHSFAPRSTRSRWTAAGLVVLATLVLLVTTCAAVDRMDAASTNNSGHPVSNVGSPEENGAEEDSGATAYSGRDHLDTDVTDSAPLPPTAFVLSQADGYIAEGEALSPFDSNPAAISNLDADLLAAIRLASLDAAAEGLEIVITSGWRSERYQVSLLEEAIVSYGSESEARRWVNTADRSTHVTGNAVDIGPPDAALWLGIHGAAYGLCQIYANEPWHFELATAPGDACPEQLRDASAG